MAVAVTVAEVEVESLGTDMPPAAAGVVAGQMRHTATGKIREVEEGGTASPQAGVTGTRLSKAAVKGERDMSLDAEAAHMRVAAEAEGMALAPGRIDTVVVPVAGVAVETDLRE